jgi:hypothetical protein
LDFSKNFLDGFLSGNGCWLWFFFRFGFCFDHSINQLLKQNYSCTESKTRAELLFLQQSVITTRARKEPHFTVVELRNPPAILQQIKVLCRFIKERSSSK